MATMPVDVFMKMQGRNGFYVHTPDKPIGKIFRSNLFQIASEYRDDYNLDNKMQASYASNRAYMKNEVRIKQDIKDVKSRSSELIVVDNNCQIKEYYTLAELNNEIQLRFRVEIPPSIISEALKSHIKYFDNKQHYVKAHFEYLAGKAMTYYDNHLLAVLKSEEQLEKEKADKKRLKQLKNRKIRNQNRARRKYELKQEKKRAKLIAIKLEERKRYKKKIETNRVLMYEKYEEELNRLNSVGPVKYCLHDIQIYYPRNDLTYSQLIDHNNRLFASSSPGKFFYNDEWAKYECNDFRLFQALHIMEGPSFLYNEFGADLKAFCVKYELHYSYVIDCLKNRNMQHRGWIFRYV